MKRTLKRSIFCALVILACILSLSSCFSECQHEYTDIYDDECDLCGDIRKVPKVTAAVLSQDGKNIIITYDDGTQREETTLCECTATAQNQYKQVCVIKEHEKDANGTYIDYCSKCHRYKSVSEIRHNETPIDDKPETCKEDGWKGKTSCTICSFESEGEKIAATNCKYDDSEPLYQYSQNPCIDGALAFKVCVVCKNLSEEPIVVKTPTDDGFDGFHTVEVWTLTKIPTEEEKGLLTGICTVCGDEEVTRTIPEVIYGGEDYEIKIENGSCAKNPATCTLKIAGAENYKYKLAEDGAKASDKLVFTTELSIKKHTVTINGEKVEIDFNKVYDPDVKNGDANVFTPSINTALNCKDGIVPSSFTCDECQGEFTVQVRKLHNYVYELDYTVTDGEYTYSLKGICQNDHCDDVVEYSHEDVVKMLTVTTPTDPTCTSCGTERHTATLGKEFETEQTELYFDVTLDALEHHFHDLYFVEGGTYNKVDIEKLAPIFSKNDGFKDFKCGQVNPLNVPCDSCKGIYNVSIEINHVLSEEFIEIPANCIEGGSKTYKCVECGEDIIILTDANGHSVTEYTEITLIDEETSLYKVNGVCSVCGEFEEETVLTYSEEKSTKSTCIEIGYDVYLKEDKTEVKIALSLAEIHVFEGVIMNKEVYVISEFQSFAESVNVISCIVPVAASYTCDVCGESFEMNIVADHIYDSGDENNIYLPDSQRLARKCTVDGCGYLNIVSNVTKTVVVPTCLNDGSITYTSGEAEIVVILIEALGHEFGPFDLNDNDKNVTAIEPIFCTKNEITANGGSYLCEHCGETVRCDIYVTHKPTDDKITTIVAPTCTESGKGVYRCPHCPETFTGDEDIIVDIPAKGHDYEYAVDPAPTADNPGIALGACKADGCDAVSEVELPVVNAENYNDTNSDIVTVKLPSCTETGIDAYTYTFTAEEKEYEVSFEVVTPVHEYAEGETVTYTYVVNEEVSFIDPYGAGEIKIVLDVIYTIFTCDNEDCHIFTILDKTFVYDGNRYAYNFENGIYELADENEGV